MTPSRLDLCWGTVMGAPLTELVAAAAGAGCTGVSVTPTMYLEARAAGESDASLRRVLDDHGVAVTLVDPLLAGLPGMPGPGDVAPTFRALFETTEDDCYAVAEALGCDCVNVAHYLGAQVPLARLVDAFGALCERAGRHGLRVFLEPMPDGGVPDLATGLAVLRGAGAPNAALMLDTWHFHRTGGRADHLNGLGPGELGGVQVSDAPAGAFDPSGGLLQRELPGRGAVELVDVLRAALAHGHDPFLGVEVFNRELSSLPHPVAARLAADALRTTLAAC